MTTNWSRQDRVRRKLALSDTDPNQCKITSYFEVVDQVSRIISENQMLTNLLFTSQNRDTDTLSINSSTTTLLSKLLTNIDNNTNKSLRSRRHNETIKKFATILYIYTGSMAYEFIHRNLPEALPSLRTVQSLIHSEYSHIEEGKFRFDELLEHLTKRNAPNIVAIAEDATRIIKKVEYDPTTNRCVGFVLPTDDDGLPKIDEYQAVF